MGGANVTVGPNVHVSRSRGEFAHHEVVLVADPKTPGRLLAGSMVVYEGGEERANTIAYASDDGGKSWRPALDNRKHQFAGDPAVAYGPDGAAYFVRLRADKFEPGRRPDQTFIDVFRSGDGGRTWADPVKIPVFTDRPYLTVDCTGGRYSGRVYCIVVLDVETLNGGPVQSLGLYASRDGGRSFGPPVYRVVTPPTVEPMNANGVVLSDGTMAMLYFLDNSTARTECVTQKKPVPAALAAENLCVAVSADGGESFGKPSAGPGRVSDFIHTKRSGIPTLAAASDGAFKDRLYSVWSDAVPQPQCQLVMFAFSRDKGGTWSKPVVLSEQPAGAGHDAFMPSAAVNKDGVVGVSWYDARFDKDNGPVRDPGWDVRFRASLDGGETWQPSVRVTERTTVFTGELRRKARKGEHLYYQAPGDTAGLAADAGGAFFPLWIDNRTGVRQVWTAAVTVDVKK
jgi:hypothetical protein